MHSRSIMGGDRLKQYILKKEAKRERGWNDATFETVDWESMEIAVKREKPGRIRRILKFQHRWLPTGDRNFEKNATRRCPACKSEEDQDHLLTCPATISKINAKLQLQLLRKTLRQIHVIPSIWMVIEAVVVVTWR